jgi:hypothetical protein
MNDELTYGQRPDLLEVVVRFVVVLLLCSLETL